MNSYNKQKNGYIQFTGKTLASEVNKFFGDVTVEEHLEEHTGVIEDIHILTEAENMNKLHSVHQERNRAIDELLQDLDPCGFNMDKFLARPAGIIPMEFRTKEREDSLGLSSWDRDREYEDRYGHEERDYDPYHDDPDQDSHGYRGEL